MSNINDVLRFVFFLILKEYDLLRFFIIHKDPAVLFLRYTCNNVFFKFILMSSRL